MQSMLYVGNKKHLDEHFNENIIHKAHRTCNYNAIKKNGIPATKKVILPQNIKNIFMQSC